jgi:flagellar protein FliJ
LKWANGPKRHNQEAFMTANKSEILRRKFEFEATQNRLRTSQIETMISALDRMCADLGQQIEVEEKRAGISDPTHFAYPTYAKAARERCAKIQKSAKALRIEVERLTFAATEAASPQFAA